MTSPVAFCVKYKDPDATKDYKWDFAPETNGTALDGETDYLDITNNESITASEFVHSDDLTLVSESLDDDSTSVIGWFSGGTHGTDYDIVCRITTSAGRIDDRTIRLKVRNQ